MLVIRNKHLSHCTPFTCGNCDELQAILNKNKDAMLLITHIDYHYDLEGEELLDELLTIHNTLKKYGGNEQMKWQFEISDCPDNMDFPIIGHQILDSGIKRGPFQFAVETMIDILSGESPLTLDADGALGKEIHSPVLPLGTILYSHTEDFNRERVTMVLPKKTWHIRYGDEKELFTVELNSLGYLFNML